MSLDWTNLIQHRPRWKRWPAEFCTEILERLNSRRPRDTAIRLNTDSGYLRIWWNRVKHRRNSIRSFPFEPNCRNHADFPARTTCSWAPTNRLGLSRAAKNTWRNNNNNNDNNNKKQVWFFINLNWENDSPPKRWWAPKGQGRLIRLEILFGKRTVKPVVWPLPVAQTLRTLPLIVEG